MPRKYRRRRTSDTWHFCVNCTSWPTSDYIERDARPTNGELCDQCRDKEKNRDCREA
jgi:hypothetical protein